MVILIPPGEKHDPTRPPDYCDSTLRYLAQAGISVMA